MLRTLLISFSLLSGLSLRAAPGDTLAVHFDRGSAHIDVETALLLHQRMAMWRRAVASGVIRPATPLIESSCSPEGSISLNNRLALQRANALLQRLHAAEEDFHIAARVQPDWALLLQRIYADHHLPARDEAISLVKELATCTPSVALSSARMAHLQNLAGGETWRHLEHHHFPAMRRSLLILPAVCCLPPPPPDTAVGSFLASLPVIPEVLHGGIPMQPRLSKRPLYMALKTNLLLDAVLLPNAGIELALGRRWSVAGSWAYNWLHTDARHYYWRIYGGDIELRRWLGDRHARKPLTGHHVGIYAGIVTYDIELGHRGYLGHRWSYFGGVSYGYSMPIGRRLNLDFTAGLGYLGGRFKEYIPDEECYVWQSTKNRTYIGPTKLEASLVWLIGRGNYNDRKGGRR